MLLQGRRFDNLVPMADGQVLHSATAETRTIRRYEAGDGFIQQAVFDRRDWRREKICVDSRPHSVKTFALQVTK